MFLFLIESLCGGHFPCWIVAKRASFGVDGLATASAAQAAEALEGTCVARGQLFHHLLHLAELVKELIDVLYLCATSQSNTSPPPIQTHLMN